jgi:DNA invertase Pin-like site-specific DNA recombinase
MPAFQKLPLAQRELMAGYARCSTDAQDLTPQLDVLTRLGAGPQRLYAGRGLTGTTRDRPGLREALAAVRAPGDTLAVAKLDRRCPQKSICRCCGLR